MDGWFGILNGCYGDQRAMSQDEIAEINMQQARNAMNNTTQFDWRLLANTVTFRPPVDVPQGWADWVAVGDELH